MPFPSNLWLLLLGLTLLLLAALWLVVKGRALLPSRVLVQSPWSRQQTLRGAHYHRIRLERLVLVGSTGE